MKRESVKVHPYLSGLSGILQGVLDVEYSLLRTEDPSV
jgi:hypothetical protein